MHMLLVCLFPYIISFIHVLGFLNGAMGTIVDIVYASDCKSPIDVPLTVMVDFNNYHGVCFREGINMIPNITQTSNWKHQLEPHVKELNYPLSCVGL